MFSCILYLVVKVLSLCVLEIVLFIFGSLGMVLVVFDSGLIVLMNFENFNVFSGLVWLVSCMVICMLR